LYNVEQVAALYDPQRHRGHAALFGQDPGVMCKSYGTVALWLLGYPDTARQEGERAIAMSHGLSPTTQAVAMHFAAMVQQLCGNPNKTHEYALRSIDIASQHGLSFWMAGSTVLAGWALAFSGQTDEGLSILRQGLADWRATGSVTYETHYLGLLAEVLMRAGQHGEAMDVLNEALALADRSGERYYEPELYRLRGALRLARHATGDFAMSDAAEDVRSAHTLARQQSARMLELRAALSLAELNRESPEDSIAIADLSRLCASFTEGRDMEDVRRAKSLLAAR
jgi:predicted ATPase